MKQKTETGILEAEAPFTLPQKVVTLKFYPKPSAMVKDKDHILYGKLGPKAQKAFQLPRTLSGSWVNPFPNKQTAPYLEEKLGMPQGWLNVNSRLETYFNDYFVSLTKAPKEFDLSNPAQYLEYLITIAQTDVVAPSLSEISKRATYMWYIEDAEVEISKKRTTISKKAEAYKLLNALEDSPAKMKQILIDRRGSSNLPTTAKDPDWLFAQLSELLEADPERFIEIADDPNLGVKVDIYEAVACGIIVKKGGFYYDEANQPLTAPGFKNDINGVIAFLALPENSDFYAIMKQQIQNAR